MIKAKAYIVREDDDTCSIYTDAPLNYGLLGEGATAEEAIANWESAYRAMKKRYKKLGKDFKEAEFEYLYGTPAPKRKTSLGFRWSPKDEEAMEKAIEESIKFMQGYGKGCPPLVEGFPMKRQSAEDEKPKKRNKVCTNYEL